MATLGTVATVATMATKASGKTKNRNQPKRLIFKSTDPVVCMTSFYQFLELHLKHRVKAKMGSSLLVDHMTMRHLTKSSSVVYKKSNPKELEMSQEQTTFQEKIRPIFEHYCSYGEKHNYVYMRRGQFLKFARDCRLMNETTDLIELNLIYQKINAQSRQSGDHEQRLSLYEFYLACELIAQRLHPGASLEDALGLLYEESLKPFAQAVPTSDPSGDALMRPDVLEVVKAHQKQLRSIFEYYAKNDQVYGRGLSWQDITHHQNHISINEFLKFGADFEVIPDLLTKSQLTQCFREANFGPKRTSHDTTRLTFPEFEDCLGRCALLGFGYDAQNANTKQETKFASDISEEAKQAWEEQQRQVPQRKFYVKKRSNIIRRNKAEVIKSKPRSPIPGELNYFPDAGMPTKFHPFTAEMVKFHKQQEQDAKEFQYYFHSLKRAEASERLKARTMERIALEKKCGLPGKHKPKWPVMPPLLRQISMTLTPLQAAQSGFLSQMNSTTELERSNGVSMATAGEG